MLPASRDRHSPRPDRPIARPVSHAREMRSPLDRWCPLCAQAPRPGRNPQALPLPAVILRLIPILWWKRQSLVEQGTYSRAPACLLVGAFPRVLASHSVPALQHLLEIAAAFVLFGIGLITFTISEKPRRRSSDPPEQIVVRVMVCKNAAASNCRAFRETLSPIGLIDVTRVELTDGIQPVGFRS